MRLLERLDSLFESRVRDPLGHVSDCRSRKGVIRRETRYVGSL